jgi:hypothetical protein
MKGCWYGSKLSNVDTQPGREVGEVGVCGGGRDEEFPRYLQGRTIH